MPTDKPAGAPAAKREGPAAKPSARKAKAKKKTKKKKKAAGKAARTPASKQATGEGPKAGPRRALVVVESPAKARTVKKYLGKGYVVKASVGHVKDLPKSRMAVDIEHGFAPQYETIRGKSKVLKEIKDAARDADVIYLAPDPDREGEAIAWHIAQELGKKHAGHTFRILFHEITQRAVLEAVAAPMPLNQRKFESQQTRRILDRLVGYQISPILWEKVRRGLSAGRVQSVAVRLVVEREAEIRAFIAEEYWSVTAELQKEHGQAGEKAFFAPVVRHRGEKFRPNNEAQAHAAVAAVQQAQLTIASVKKSERRRRPLAPLITSKLQQEAAGRLRYTAKRTMMLAQQLYEGIELGDEGSVGLITYMRTDSTRLSNDAITDVREFIGREFGNEYLPVAPVEYRNKKNAQDAHEAIRPTSTAYPPERVKAHLSPEQFNLYSLIWRSFVACQMEPAVYSQITALLEAGEYELRASGSTLLFPGFLRAYEGLSENAEADAASDSEDNDAKRPLPMLNDGDAIATLSVVPKQHFTQPPPRFSESTLVRELEESGIGRPSTYATILSTIVTRGYVEKVEGRFFPTELGLLVTELLLASFPAVLDVAFTAEMERQLDEVETGEVDWVRLLNDFYFGGFAESIERAKEAMRDVKREEVPTDHVCDKCSKTMMKKWGRNGSFLACEGYPACRNTRDYKRLPDGTIELVPELTTDEKCRLCKGGMVVKRGRYGQFLACQTYPECKGTRPMSIGVDCPNKCGNYLSERSSKRGRTFYGCAGFPACTFALWDRPIAGTCPMCSSPYLVRKYSKRDGVTIKCPNKECGYLRDPELDDQDARAVAS